MPIEKKFDVGQPVAVFNREKKTHEMGVVTNTYVRQKVRRYDVLLERKILMEFLSINRDANYFINEELSNKMNGNATS